MGSRSCATGAEGPAGPCESSLDQQPEWQGQGFSSWLLPPHLPVYLYCLDPAMKIRSEKVGLNSWLFSPK